MGVLQMIDVRWLNYMIIFSFAKILELQHDWYSIIVCFHYVCASKVVYTQQTASLPVCTIDDPCRYTN